MNDVFISYAHIDNESLTEGQKGWISQLHRTREVRLRQLMGENPKVWRDQKLMGNDVFDETLEDQFSKARVMVSIVSPRYVKSEWCQREALEFHDAAEKSDPTSRVVPLAKGELALSKSDFTLASRVYQLALKKFPNDAEIHFGVAKSFESSDRKMMQKHLEAAIAAKDEELWEAEEKG